MALEVLRQARYDGIVFSPHLDDAALSCGGRIHRRTVRGEKVLVVTIFTGDVPEGPLPELAGRVLLSMGLGRDEAMEVRRAEDEAACEILGAEPVHWPYLECPLRRDASGDPLYTDYRQLFSKPRPEDEALVDDIAAAMADLPPADHLVAPLGVGSHVDHHIVRRAAERTFQDRLAFYEDFPYVRKTFALSRALGKRSDWRDESLSLDEGNLRAKIRSIAAYGTQVPPLFGDEARMERRVRRWARKVRGERQWFPSLQ
ncbi:MAG: PIG-L family deacetylase [Acidobacteriota bacterium]